MLIKASMEVWQYIEVLRKPGKTWFFSKDHTQEKLQALAKIMEVGYPSLISGLTDFLLDQNKEIRETTCQTIVHLFKKVHHKKSLYETLKHCRITKTHIDFYKANFNQDQYIDLLAICSLNSNGYVREKAVKKLSQAGHPKAIQFLIYRLADWVIPVRQAAAEGIKHYLTVDHIDGLIENLPTFEWLQKVERTDLSGIYQDIITFIASTNRDYVLTNFKQYPDKLRLILAKQISVNLGDTGRELALFLSDSHFLVRNLSLAHFNQLEQNQVNMLLNDKSAKVRMQALYSLQDQQDFENLIRKYLADKSGTIRHFARFTLQLSHSALADFYCRNLEEGDQIIGSISGLAEIEAKQQADAVKTYLVHPKIRIVKTAFWALCKLDAESAYAFAIAKLDSDYIGLRHAVIDYLSTRPVPEVLDKARAIYQSGDFGLQKSMLRLFYKIGGWKAISDLMLATVDENENLRHLAFNYLTTWKRNAVRLFVSPKPGELEKAREVFKQVYSAHEREGYFDTNPVNGMEFYFK